MKTYSVEAVVLRLRPLGEADRIVTLFSRERGKISAVARGARKPHSKFGGRLDFFARVELALHGGKSLDVITAAKTVRSVWERLVNPQAFAAASYVAEVIDSLSELDMAVPELYAVLAEYHDVLAAVSTFDSLLACMDLKILSALGFAPELDACARCGAALGRRPLSGGRAWLSPQAGGLLCSACVRSLRDPGAGSGEDLVSLSAADFRALLSLRDVSLQAAGGENVKPAVARATRAFVEYQMGRRSKVFSSGAARSKALSGYA